MMGENVPDNTNCQQGCEATRDAERHSNSEKKKKSSGVPYKVYLPHNPASLLLSTYQREINEEQCPQKQQQKKPVC